MKIRRWLVTGIIRTILLSFAARILPKADARLVFKTWQISQKTQKPPPTRRLCDAQTGRDLLLFRSGHGAHARASAAADALFRIDFILAVAFGNRLHRAFGLARAARDALIVNLIRHKLHLLLGLSCVLYHLSCGNAIPFLHTHRLSYPPFVFA